MFEPNSRYSKLETATIAVPDLDGTPRTLRYVRRRFIPSSAGMTVLMEHSVIQSDRLDTITARYLSDPTLFWQVCDANQVLHPADLEQVGRRVNIALPAL